METKEEILKKLENDRFIRMSKNKFGKIIFESNLYTEEIKEKLKIYFLENDLKFKAMTSLPSDLDIIYKKDFDVSKIEK